MPIKIKKNEKTYKNGEETIKIIIYKLKFINSKELMASSLSNLVEKCKIKYKDCDCYLEYAKVKYGSLIFKV